MDGQSVRRTEGELERYDEANSRFFTILRASLKVTNFLQNIRQPVFVMNSQCVAIYVGNEF